MKIMGVLNITADSFFSKSRCLSVKEAVTKAETMILDGADIIDLGAESTRPGARYVSPEEELERLIPILEELLKLQVPFSVDTYKAAIAQQALECGAIMINDVSAGRYDPCMLPLVRDYHVPIVLMHNSFWEGELPHATKNCLSYENVLHQVCVDLKLAAETAEGYGIKKENIILDPGLGFRKSLEDNLTLIKNIDVIKTLGYKVLLGASNKGFIGRVLNVKTMEERLEGNIAIAVFAAMYDVDIIRVHDVLPHAKVIKMIDAVIRGELYYEKYIR